MGGVEALPLVILRAAKAEPEVAPTRGEVLPLPEGVRLTGPRVLIEAFDCCRMRAAPPPTGAGSGSGGSSPTARDLAAVMNESSVRAGVPIGTTATSLTVVTEDAERRRGCPKPISCGVATGPREAGGEGSLSPEFCDMLRSARAARSLARSTRGPRFCGAK